MTEDIRDVATEDIRKGLLRRLLEQDEALEESYDDLAERINRRLRSNSTPAEVRRAVMEEIRATIQQRQALVSATILGTADEGADAHERETGFTRREGFQSPAAAVLRGELAPGPDISIPQRIRLADQEAARRLALEAASARRAGLSAVQAADRFMQVAGDALERDLPAYIERLIRDVEQGGPEARAALDAFKKRIEAQGSVAGSQFTIRGANLQLMRDLRRATGNDVRNLVDNWIRQRARLRARTIARTEAVRAFSESYVRKARTNPDVEALKFNLSSSHPEPDICDLLAGQNPDGLGPGVYRPSSVPVLPAHPHCLCFFTSVLVNADGSSSIEPSEPADAQDWLAAQTPERRRAILGPTRAAIFGNNRAAVVTPRGRLFSVRKARTRA